MANEYVYRRRVLAPPQSIMRAVGGNGQVTLTQAPGSSFIGRKNSWEDKPEAVGVLPPRFAVERSAARPDGQILSAAQLEKGEAVWKPGPSVGPVTVPPPPAFAVAVNQGRLVDSVAKARPEEQAWLADRREGAFSPRETGITREERERRAVFGLQMKDAEAGRAAALEGTRMQFVVPSENVLAGTRAEANAREVAAREEGAARRDVAGTEWGARERVAAGDRTAAGAQADAARGEQARQFNADLELKRQQFEKSYGEKPQLWADDEGNRVLYFRGQMMRLGERTQTGATVLKDDQGNVIGAWAPSGTIELMKGGAAPASGADKDPLGILPKR